MPGVLHQGILDLLRDDPWLPFDLLGLERPGSGPLIDRRAEVEYVVVSPREHGGEKVRVGLPDLVLTTRAPDEPGPGVVVCIEAQEKRDADKRYSIPFYQGALAHHHKLQTWVVVVSLSPAYSGDLARWSQGPPPRVEVLLLDADTIPLPVTVEAARMRPTAAVLVATMHARRGDLDAARLGLSSILELPQRTRLRYTQTILAAVSKTRREILEAEIPVEERNKLWDIERQGSPYLYGVEEGLARGIEQGREQGLEQGLEQGRRETLVELILALLEIGRASCRERVLVTV